MRIKFKERVRPPIGTKRRRRVFLFLPWWNSKEFRWLEFADVVETYGEYKTLGGLMVVGWCEQHLPDASDKP